jgi:4-aminobutyrate aminotransferase-like enzyme
LGDDLAERFSAIAGTRGVVDARGRGLMWGIELRDGSIAAHVASEALRHRIIVLQSGVRGEVLSITPPIVIGEEELERALQLLATVIRDAG